MVDPAAGGRQQDVRGLDVAVDEPARVRRVEARGDLRDDARGARGLDPAGLADERLQVGPVDVAHDEIQPAGLLARPVHGNDVRVVDRGRHPDLAAEAVGEVAVGDALGRDDLQRDPARERELPRAVDDAHAAAARHRLDAAAGEALTGQQVVHIVKCDRPRQPPAQRQWFET